MKKNNLIINYSKFRISYKQVLILLTDLVDGSYTESVTVAVLQRLNLHLQMKRVDNGNDDYEGDKKDEKNDDEKPFYLPAGLPQLGASHCPASGPVPRSDIWPKVL